MDEQPWLQRANEDDKWYHRFVKYLALGGVRSIRAVYNAELIDRGKQVGHSRPVPSSWTLTSRYFEWHSRAKAYDKWQAKILLESMREKFIEPATAVIDLMESTPALYRKLNYMMVRLEVLESRIAELEARPQQAIASSLSKRTLSIPDIAPPKGFTWLSEFAGRHCISLPKAEALYYTGVIYGQRITVSKRRSFIAIEARGQRDFWVQFHADTDFRPCNECPHS